MDTPSLSTRYTNINFIYTGRHLKYYHNILDTPCQHLSPERSDMGGTLGV